MKKVSFILIGLFLIMLSGCSDSNGGSMPITEENMQEYMGNLLALIQYLHFMSDMPSLEECSEHLNKNFSKKTWELPKESFSAISFTDLCKSLPMLFDINEKHLIKPLKKDLLLLTHKKDLSSKT